jgi:hypothetical protein
MDGDIPVKERMVSNDTTVECESYYDCLEDTIESVEEEQLEPQNSLALRYVRQQR